LTNHTDKIFKQDKIRVQKMVAARGFRILMVTPTPMEYEAVRDAIGEWMMDGTVRLERCGVGPQQATNYCQQLDDRVNFDWLVLVGYAGGLRRDLQPGDLILADRALAAGQPHIPCTSLLVPGTVTGPVLTVPELLATPKSKQAALTSGALAVEMEAYPLAAWALIRKLPFLHARVILDGLDEHVPNLGNSLDPSGRPRMAQLLFQLLKRPPLAPQLLSFAWRVNSLKPHLGACARAVVGSITSLRG
jgi:nucleoside phosphorylase